MKRLATAAPGHVAAVGCIAFVFIVGGCGSDGDPNGTPLGRQTTGASSGTDGPAVTGEPPASPGGTTNGADSAAIDVTDVTEQATGFPGLPSFTSPTGNITCTMTNGDQGGYTVCWVAEADWEIADPGNCDLDWMATELSVGDTSSAGSCRGDYPHTEDPATLDYGQGLRVADVVCESRDTGVTCFNTGTGHGFHASRGSYRVF